MFIFHILVKSEYKFQFLGSYTLVVEPMGVKFGMEEGTQGRLALRAMLPVINAPQGRIPARFSRNLHTSYLVSGALTVNISMDLLKGLRSDGGFN